MTTSPSGRFNKCSPSTLRTRVHAAHLRRCPENKNATPASRRSPTPGRRFVLSRTSRSRLVVSRHAWLAGLHAQGFAPCPPNTTPNMFNSAEGAHTPRLAALYAIFVLAPQRNARHTGQ